MTANNGVISTRDAKSLPARGPESWTPITNEERKAADVLPEDWDILQLLIPRLWKVSAHAEPALALEVIDGPYKGVVFSFSDFQVSSERLENGFVPAKFDVAIRSAPEGFTHDESFDTFAREVLLSWLSYIATHDFREIVRVETQGSIS